MTRVLLLGFSVTEMVNSYVPRLKFLAAKRGSGVEIDHCGMGGITTESLPYFVDHIIAGRPDAERVVFEVATSYVRDVYREHCAHDPDYRRVIWQHFAALIEKTRALGRDVAFINLPRADTDYEMDFLESIMAQVCIGYGVPLLSVSTELMLRGIPLSSILVDEVHPNVTGAELYAENILDFLTGLGVPRAVPALSKIRFESIAFKDVYAGERGEFRRHGFYEDFAILGGGQSITIALDRPRLIEGVAVLTGPRGGWLAIQTDRENGFMFYDQHCYYPRMMTVTGALGKTDTVTIELGTDVPETALLKGEKDFGPRQMGLFYLFCQDPL